MAQYISKGDIFGRIGTGLGQGIAEQLPKEVERGRLASGLSNLEQQQGLTPFQQFSRLAAIPGITPQMLQSGTELLRQQGISEGLRKGAGAKQQASEILRGGPKPIAQEKPIIGPNAEAKGFATPEQTMAAISPYIPKNLKELQDRAAELADENPQLYPTAKDALAGAVQEDQAFQNQSAAQLAARQSATGVEAHIKSELERQFSRSKANVPDAVYNRVENDVIDQVANGKPETQATKEGRTRLEEMSRNFSNIRGWGNLGVLTKNPKDLLGSVSSLQKQAKRDGYQKEAAESLVADVGVTPRFAHALMYPVSDTKALNDEIKALPKIEAKTLGLRGGFGPITVGGLADSFLGADRAAQKSREETAKIAPRLVKAMGLEGSPLAVAYELERKGYDPEIWKQYLIDHQDELNLTSHQQEELQKSQNLYFGLLNDLWLKSFTGIK